MGLFNTVGTRSERGRRSININTDAFNARVGVQSAAGFTSGGQRIGSENNLRETSRLAQQGADRIAAGTHDRFGRVVPDEPDLPNGTSLAGGAFRERQREQRQDRVSGEINRLVNEANNQTSTRTIGSGDSARTITLGQRSRIALLEEARDIHRNYSTRAAPGPGTPLPGEPRRTPGRSLFDVPEGSRDFTAGGRSFTQDARRLGDEASNAASQLRPQRLNVQALNDRVFRGLRRRRSGDGGRTQRAVSLLGGDREGIL